MPTRTAFIITIGDVIETGPPRRTTKRRYPDDPASPSASSESSTSDVQDVPAHSLRRRGSETMKTRVSNGGAVVLNGGSAAAVGTTGRRSRIHSVDQLYGTTNSNNNPLSPRTRSSVKQEVDEEVSFVDPLSSVEDELDEKVCNGENGHHSSEDPNSDSSPQCLKKKRKSSAEKFLEDNSEYYGFQVLPSKLRSTVSNDQFPNPFLDFLQREGGGGGGGGVVVGFGVTGGTDKQVEETQDSAGTTMTSDRRSKQRHRSAGHAGDPLDTSSGLSRKSSGDRSRHSSGASMSVRRIRANSSSSNHHGDLPFSTNKRLRVEVEKMDLQTLTSGASGNDSSSDTEEDTELQMRQRQRKKLRTRKSENSVSSPSPTSKKRRSELDKLLEAGSSSFHFETARQAASRIGENGLGPIHVDVSDHSNSGQEEFVSKMKVEENNHVNGDEADNDNEEESSNGVASSGLLQQADVNQNSKSSPTRGKRGRPRAGKRSLKRESPKAENSTSAPSSPIIPASLFSELRVVDGFAAEIDELQYSFERTPFREGWFQTYSRQDQGDEILFYPEPRSFMLPYEMPVTTFYPRGNLTKKGVKRKLLGETGGNTPIPGSSAVSGTATPIDYDEDSLPPPPPPPVRTTRGKTMAANANSNNTSRRTRTRTDSEKSLTLSLFDKLDPKKAAQLRAASEFSRKSPRCHASTKSLMNASSPYVDDMDDDVFEELIDVERVSPAKSNNLYLDECSNDSSAAGDFNAKKKTVETALQFSQLASSLDMFFCEEDPMLASSVAAAAAATTSSGKRSRRRSSDKHHKHKHKKTSKEDNEDPLDRLVASNVDEVLLDCLEDELPSVTFDSQPPGSDPLELIDSYEQCSLLFPGHRRKKSLQNQQGSARIIPDANDHDAENTAAKESNSTILKRLLTDTPPPRVPTKGKGPRTLQQSKNVNRLVGNSNDDSSSEYTSACETASLASSTGSGHRRKKKRNLTGFPNPKKKKKPPALLNNVLASNAAKMLVVKKQRQVKTDKQIMLKKRGLKTKTGKEVMQRKKKLKTPLLSSRFRISPVGKKQKKNNKSPKVRKGRPPTTKGMKKVGKKRLPKRNALRSSNAGKASSDVDGDDDSDQHDDDEDEAFSLSRRKKIVTKRKKLVKKKASPPNNNKPNRKVVQKTSAAKKQQRVVEEEEVIVIESTDEEEVDDKVESTAESSDDDSDEEGESSEGEDVEEDSDDDDNEDDSNDDDDEEEEEEDDESEEEVNNRPSRSRQCKKSKLKLKLKSVSTRRRS